MSPVRPLLPASLLSAFACAALLTACGTSGTTSTSTSSTSTKDALYFPSSNIPVAYLGEIYTASIQVAGGIGPYSVRLASGKLPDGLTLNGSVLSGKPSKAGLYTFTVEASDASLSTKAQPMSLTVADLPPFSLALSLPTSEIRGETRIPLTVTAPRGMRAFRLQWALPAGVTVTRIAPMDTRAVAYWKMTDGTLTLDMGFRTGVASGDRLALVTVKPSKPVTLQNPVMGYNALAADGTVVQTLAMPVAAPAILPSGSSVPTVPGQPDSGQSNTLPAQPTTLPGQPVVPGQTTPTNGSQNPPASPIPIVPPPPINGSGT
ncbi:Ig domain-containing protein [Deinococcus sp. UYEF24]